MYADLSADEDRFVVFGWKNNSNAFCISGSTTSSRFLTTKYGLVPAATVFVFVRLCHYVPEKRYAPLSPFSHYVLCCHV